jgi:hypothetical protein
LISAAIYGHEGCVRLLLESKASVNATSVSLERALPQAHVPWTSCPVVIHWPSPQQNYDSTALHCAANNGHLAIAKRLLEGGADLTLRTKVGQTALDYARSQGKSDVVALLSEPRYTPRGTQSDRCMIATRFPCGGGEAPSWAHADRGFSAARQTNGGELPWDEAERTQRTPPGSKRRLATARP